MQKPKTGEKMKKKIWGKNKKRKKRKKNKT
jgi:hypothetical protein